MSEIGKPHTKITIQPEVEPVPQVTPTVPEHEPVETKEKTPA
jgi:hypothetical protein